MTLKGVLRWVDLGTGAWVLEQANGERVALYGDIPRALRDKPVVVQGSAAEVMGFAMVGSASIQVRSVVFDPRGA